MSNEKAIQSIKQLVNEIPNDYDLQYLMAILMGIGIDMHMNDKTRLRKKFGTKSVELIERYLMIEGK